MTNEAFWMSFSICSWEPGPGSGRVQGLLPAWQTTAPGDIRHHQWLRLLHAGERPQQLRLI